MLLEGKLLLFIKQSLKISLVMFVSAVKTTFVLLIPQPEIFVNAFDSNVKTPISVYFKYNLY